MNKETGRNIMTGIAGAVIIGGITTVGIGMKDSISHLHDPSAVERRVEQQVLGYNRQEYIKALSVAASFQKQIEGTAVEATEKGVRTISIEIPENTELALNILNPENETFVKGNDLYNKKLHKAEVYPLIKVGSGLMATFFGFMTLGFFYVSQKYPYENLKSKAQP